MHELLQVRLIERVPLSVDYRVFQMLKYWLMKALLG